MRQLAKPRDRIVGVRGYECDERVGGKGRLAAQRMSMFPTHSAGPCMQDTPEVSFDILKTLHILTRTVINNT